MICRTLALLPERLQIPEQVVQLPPLMAGSDYFKGRIDEVRLFNTALSNAEIQALMIQP